MTRNDAEENLRIIRSLMERATVYRAISAPTALAGGAFSCLGAIAFRTISNTPHPTLSGFTNAFLGIWCLVLILTLFTNTILLLKDARLRKAPLFSSGMRLALSAMLPSLLCGLFFSISIGIGKHPFWLPPIWMTCYALSLLSTKHFAPKSIILLGWAFLLAGLVTFYLMFGSYPNRPTASGDLFFDGNELMGVTFGLFHLIYAACTWKKQTPETPPSDV